MESVLRALARSVQLVESDRASPDTELKDIEADLLEAEALTKRDMDDFATTEAVRAQTYAVLAALKRAQRATAHPRWGLWLAACICLVAFSVSGALSGHESPLAVGALLGLTACGGYASSVGSLVWRHTRLTPKAEGLVKAFFRQRLVANDEETKERARLALALLGDTTESA
jgi:hypothetical protein